MSSPCRRCGGPKPEGAAPSRWYCDACRELAAEERREKTKVAAEAWRQRNRERVRAQARSRRRKPCARCGGEKPPGERRRYCDACREVVAEENKAKVSERSRKWFAANRDRAKSVQRLYRQSPTGRAGALTRQVRFRHPEAPIIETVDPLEVFRRDVGLCGICEKAVDPNAFDIDHVLALSAGGEHSYANVQLAHRTCNASKNRTTDEAARKARRS